MKSRWHETPTFDWTKSAECYTVKNNEMNCNEWAARVSRWMQCNETVWHCNQIDQIIYTIQTRLNLLLGNLVMNVRKLWYSTFFWLNCERTVENEDFSSLSRVIGTVFLSSLDCDLSRKNTQVSMKNKSLLIQRKSVNLHRFLLHSLSIK